MKLELDHFFILTEPGAPEGDQLASLGIEESFSRLHKGQGTSNRRFPVSNSMLELLWVRDAAEATSGPAKGLLFPERANDRRASPFGLIFTRKTENENENETGTGTGTGTGTDKSMPFAGWNYQPDYFDPPMAFHVGDNSSLLIEPLVFYVPFIEPVTRKIEVGKFGSISHVRVTVPSTVLSDTLTAVKSAAGLDVVTGEEHLIEVTYNLGASGMTQDCRPGLPMILTW